MSEESYESKKLIENRNIMTKIFFFTLAIINAAFLYHELDVIKISR